jgi:hypothetical protein
MRQEIQLITKNDNSFYEIIEHLENENIIDWGYLSENLSKDINLDYFLEKHEDKIDFKRLSKNTNIPWSLDIIEKYLDKWSYTYLSENYYIPWTEKFILKHIEKWIWGGYKSGNGHKSSEYFVGGLSKNPSLPINIPFLKKIEHKIDFRSFGMNSALFIFNPIGIPLEYYPCDIEDVVNAFDAILEFWDKWSFEGSYWFDAHEGISGNKKDSIKDNSCIEWDIYEKHKNDYHSYFSTQEDYDLPPFLKQKEKKEDIVDDDDFVFPF